MAAILAAIAPPQLSPAGRAQWEHGCRHLSRRTSGTDVAIEAPACLIAVRLASAASLYDDGTSVIVVDGFLDQTPAGADDAAYVARLLGEQGPEGLDTLTGSFAIAVWNRQTTCALLVRDRFATKPLFYARTSTGWCWGSQIQAMTPLLPSVTVDRQALPELIHYRWLAGERTLVDGVRQVLPGHAVTLDPRERAPRARRYFRLGDLPRESGASWDTWRNRADEALTAYFARVSRRFRRVGILLSAGVDSSLLAAKASQTGFERCLAVTGRIAGFENPELPGAMRTAAHLGIEHRVVDVTDPFLEGALPGFVERIEYPHRNYTGLVMQRLIESLGGEVDAIVFGEGADTMFGCREAVQLEQYDAKQRRLRGLPWWLRNAAARAAGTIPGSLAARAATLLELDTVRQMQALDHVDYLVSPSDIVPGIPRVAAYDPDALAAFDRPGDPLLERYQSLSVYSDCRCRIDLLDRLTEPLGLQVLSPFFARELTDVAGRLPEALMRRGTESKPILRDIACRHFPREWIYEQKMGFPVPLTRWLDGPFASHLEAVRRTRSSVRTLLADGVLERIGANWDPEMTWTILTLDLAVRRVIDADRPGGSPAAS